MKVWHVDADLLHADRHVMRQVVAFRICIPNTANNEVVMYGIYMYCMWSWYEGHLESKERFAIKKHLLIIGKKKNMQVLSHTFTYFST